MYVLVIPNEKFKLLWLCIPTVELDLVFCRYIDFLSHEGGRTYLFDDLWYLRYVQNWMCNAPCQASARVYIARHLLHMLDDSSNLKYAKLGVF